MSPARVASCLIAAVTLMAGHGTSAHDTGHGAAVAAAAAKGEPTEIAVALDSGAAPQVVSVALGARVRLTVTGAEGRALHLHGYDIEASAPAGAPVVLEFDASHEGRFAVEMHVTDDLLGAREKPVLWIEVRAP